MDNRLKVRTEQQRFTMQSDVLTSVSSRQRSAISGNPFPNERTLDPQSQLCALSILQRSTDAFYITEIYLLVVNA